MTGSDSLDGLTPSGFFALRSPLLPFDDFRDWTVGADRAQLTDRLLAIWRRPEVREAVFLASPELDAALERSSAGDSRDKSLRSLAAYVSRMASRSTPFGLFAGCSTGSFQSSTHLELGPCTDYGRHTRLDMDYLSALVSALETDASVRSTLRYQPNSSLYRAGSRLHYAEARVAASGRTYHLVALEETPELRATLQRASHGASLAELSCGLIAERISADEARAYVEELVANQVLVSNLGPPVTGAEAIHALIDRLGLAPEAACLEQVRDGLAQIDQAGVGGSPPERYAELQGALASLPAQPELARLFQVDMVKPAPGLSLGPKVVDELARGIRVLQQLNHAGDSGGALRDFAERFTARYEGAAVPLVEALDEELGIGFRASAEPGGEPLLHGLDQPAAAPQPGTWRAQDTTRLRLLAEALRTGQQAIELTSADLDALASTEPAPPLPDAVAVFARLAAASAAAIDRGEFRLWIHNVGGPSGARLLGRFCHADPELHRWVAEHLRAEEARQPDAVFAEIVHLPEGRLGNILSRPVLRDYEISFLGQSGATCDRQLPITDLQVSVRGTRIVLRSKRLNREVAPRLSTAHNFGMRSLGLYRFLCALQHQGTSSTLGWSWGALEQAPFLPRVTCGRLVLSRARWELSAADLRPLVDNPRAVQDVRARLRLPRYVALADFDNELVVDLDNELSVESFVHLVRHRDTTQLVEVFPDPEELCATGPEGRFFSELVVPFVKSARVPAQPDRTPARSTTVRRQFAPGSEWLYAKIYTGPTVADRVLTDVIAPIVADAGVDNWFFIRYKDPEPHLRLRLHGDPRRLAADMLPQLADRLAPLVDDGQIARWQLDTYVREVERYGGDEAILLAERLFGADSACVLDILPTVPGDDGLAWRWKLALCGVDLLLEAFGIEDRCAWVRRQRDAFANEFRVDSRVKRQLGEKYRAERQSVDELLRLVHDAQAERYPPLRALRRRTDLLAPIVDELRHLERAGRLSDSCAGLAASYAHMHINRLLRSAHRYQELVLYELLDRTYRSQVARA